MTSPSDPSGTGPPPRTERPDTTAERLGALANLGWQILLTTGLAAIALGVVVLAWPEETLRVVGALFGVYLLVIGVFQLAAAFGTHVPGHLRALHFLTGALSRVSPHAAGAGVLERSLSPSPLMTTQWW